MKEIIAVQHTQSVHHTNGMIGSSTDWDLSPQGVKEAQQIAANLANELSGEWVIYTSSLKRSVQTADILGEALNTVPILAKELNERHLGEAVGQSLQWLEENISCKEASIDDRCFPSAESQRDLWNRLAPFVNSLMSLSNQKIIVVSHGEALSVLFAIWLKLVPENLNHCHLQGFSGGVSFLQESSDGKRWIRKLSDMSYMNSKLK